jgi:hypothetical protein
MLLADQRLGWLRLWWPVRIEACELPVHAGHTAAAGRRGSQLDAAANDSTMVVAFLNGLFLERATRFGEGVEGLGDRVAAQSELGGQPDPLAVLGRFGVGRGVDGGSPGLDAMATAGARAHLHDGHGADDTFSGVEFGVAEGRADSSALSAQVADLGFLGVDRGLLPSDDDVAVGELAVVLDL